MNPAPPAPDTSAIDADAIARLRRDLDPEGRHDIVPRILRTYDNSLSGMITKLEDIAVSLDRDALFQVAHKMKSSSASVGALALGARCTEVDRAIRDGQPLDVGHAVATLLAEGRRAQAAVRAMLGS